MNIAKKRIIKISVLLLVLFFITAIILSTRVAFFKNTLNFISNEILGMHWLNRTVDNILQAVFGSDIMIKWYGKFLSFFIYDTIKIIILLCFLIFIISYIQSYFPPEKTKKILSKLTGIKGNIIGALLGTVTPFCSCSSIPLFMGFTKANIRSGITFSFLISSPLVDLGAFILLAGTFGFHIAIIYVVVGLILAVAGGFIIEKLKAEKYIEPFISKNINVTKQVKELTVKDRLSYAKNQMLFTLKKVYLFIFIGVGIGALIHNVIPAEWINAILGKNNIFSVIISTLVGVPMYADIFGTIPIAEALYLKGVGLGTILAFMMSVTALSLPSLILLRKVVKPKLLIIFVSVVTVGIIIIGYVFNILNYLFI